MLGWDDSVDEGVLCESSCLVLFLSLSFFLSCFRFDASSFQQTNADSLSFHLSFLSPSLSPSNLRSLRSFAQPDSRGKWLYRGYVVAGGAMVGRWRDSFSELNYHGYEGSFHMTRRS